MVVRFPHILTYTTEEIEGYFDENGNYVEGTQGVIVTEPCRAEPNARAEYITNEADGTRTEFSFVVYLTKGIALIPVGIQVTITGKAGLVFKGATKRFHSEQLHSRLWV